MPLEVICFALKMTGAILIMAGCTGMGYMMCTGLSGRMRALLTLRQLVLHMSGEIRCMAEPLPAMLMHTAAVGGTVYRDFFLDVGKALGEGQSRPMAEIWDEKADLYLSGGPLSTADIELIKKLGQTLGTHDVKMQLSLLELFAGDVQTAIDGLRAGMERQKKLYGGLWVLGGVFIVILLI